jgi:hypothetical protein
MSCPTVTAVTVRAGRVHRIATSSTAVPGSIHAGALDFGPLLYEEIERLPELFEVDELAYLALTSKIELPIRDRLAFALYKRLDQRLVAREWKRVDLAVLGTDGSTPELLLEAKALYTFDLIGEAVWVDRFPKRVRDDVAALRNRSDLAEWTQLFALVLATHPLSQAGPASPRCEVLARSGKGNRGARRCGGCSPRGRRGPPGGTTRGERRGVCGRNPGRLGVRIEIAVPYWLIAASPFGSAGLANG